MDFALIEKDEIRLGKARQTKKFLIAFSLLLLLSFAFLFFEVFTGVSNMTFFEAFMALFGQGKESHIRIMQQIRLPRAIGGFLVGGGLSLAGLLMQTSLHNPMASPGTLGVSNAAVLGANIAIILLSDNPINGTVWNNPSPYGVAAIAFVSALLSTVLVMFLGGLKHFHATTIILIGVGLGALLQAFTTLIQFFAADNTLASAVYWSFGDIGRLNPNDNIFLAIIIIVGLAFLLLLSSRYDALLLGEGNANSLGLKIGLLRFITMLMASLITASIVSLCGIIGFVGIVAPHICRRIIGGSHKYLIPTSFCMGTILVVGSDFIGRLFSKGTSLPVGAVTALIGAPFFIFLLLGRKEKSL